MINPFDDQWGELDAFLAECQDASTQGCRDLIAALRDRDPDLADRAQLMLNVMREPTRRLDIDLDVLTPERPERLPLGATCGAYRISQHIGSGGMGDVYRAARVDGAYHQEVAIKVLSSDPIKGTARARFHLERQLLATLDHPGIAHLFDGGVLDSGAPYMVMELIDGVPIDDYCTRHRLAIRERVELVMQVCEALDYAHRHRVIHRDIKPANILVDADGRARLLDFGIARLEDPTNVYSNLTRGVVMMTPAYACPEQARGLVVSTAGDIYSLGAVLYELIVGAPAIDLTQTDILQSLSAICDQPPRRFRTAIRARSGAELDQFCRDRSMNPSQLKRVDSGDLEAVVMKALNKDPERRYASASAFREDLTNYLEGMPVRAHPDSAWYRLGKIVKRRPWASGLAAIAALSLAGLTLGLAIQLQRADRQRLKAERTTRFMTEMFRDSSPSISGEADLRAIDVLRQASSQLAFELQDEPMVRAELLDTVSTVQRYLRDREQGADAARRALAIKDAHLDPDDPGLAPTLTNLGFHLILSDQIAEGLHHLSRARDILHEHGLSNSEAAADILMAKAFAQQIRGRTQEARESYREVLQRFTGDDPWMRDNREAVNLNLGWLLLREGDFDGAEPFFRESLRARRASRGPDHPATVVCEMGMFEWELAAGRRDDAQRRARRLVHDHADFLELNPGINADLQMGLSEIERDPAAAREHMDRALEAIRRVSSPRGPAYIHVQISQSATLLKNGQPSAALRVAQEALNASNSLNDRAQLQASACVAVANAYQALGDLTLAEKLFLEALSKREALYGREQSDVIAVKLRLAWLLFTTGRLKQAQALYETCLDVLETRPGPDYPIYHQERVSYGWVLNSLGDKQGARAIFEAAVQQLTRVCGPRDASVARAQHALAWALFEQGEVGRAIDVARQAIATWTALFGPHNADLAWSQNNLALMLHSRGQSQDALVLMQEAFETRHSVLGPLNSKTLESQGSLFRLQRVVGKDVDAYENGCRLVQRMDEVGNLDLARLIARELVELATDLGRTREAEKWRAKLDAEAAAIENRP